MAIRFKVVTQDRKSVTFMYARDDVRLAYECVYLKDTIVCAPPGTLGLFCFETYRDALNSISNWVQPVQIIKVKTTKRGRRPKAITGVWWRSLEYMRRWYANPQIDAWPPNIPPGTICYDEVEVLT